MTETTLRTRNLPARARTQRTADLGLGVGATYFAIVSDIIRQSTAAPDGTRTPSSPAQGERLAPWVLLVCTDLGFESSTPETVTVAELDTRIAAHASSAPHCAASMSALRVLASTAGTSGSFKLALFSATAADMPSRLASALERATTDGFAADMVLWDYPVGLSMADMKALTMVGYAADLYRTLVLTSLDGREQLVDAAMHEESIRGLLRDDYAVPLRRLRHNPVSRFIVLCSPPLRLTGELSPTSPIGGAWLVAHDLERMMIDSVSPLHAQVPSQEEFDRSFQFALTGTRRVAPEIVREAHEAGLMMLSDRPTEHRFPLRTLAYPEVCGDSGHLAGHHLLSGRLYRLSRAWLSTPSASPARLRDYLASVAAGPLHLSSSDRAVRVTTEGARIVVEVTLDRTLGGRSITFDIDT